MAPPPRNPPCSPPRVRLPRPARQDALHVAMEALLRIMHARPYVISSEDGEVAQWVPEPTQIEMIIKARRLEGGMVALLQRFALGVAAELGG